MKSGFVEMAGVFAAGAALGFFYFGALWLTVKRLPHAARPAAGSFVLRNAAALLGFYHIMEGRWERLLASLAGFLAMRSVLVRRWGTEPHRRCERIVTDLDRVVDPLGRPLDSGGRGQRELILGDRQTGKAAVPGDAIINQKGRDVLCFYCAVGKRGTAVAKVIADLRRFQAMDFCTVIVATEEDPPGLQYAAP